MHKAIVIWSETLMKFGSRVGHVPVPGHRKYSQSMQQSCCVFISITPNPKMVKCIDFLVM